MVTASEILAETFGPDYPRDEPGRPKLRELDHGALLSLMQGSHGSVLRSEFASLRPWCSIMADTTQGLAIDATGNVTTCCFDSKFENKLSNIYEADIRQVWQKYKEALLGDLFNHKYCAFNCIGRGYSYSPPLIDNEAENQRSAWRSAHFSDFPQNVLIEPAASCNYACEGCPANTNTGAMADFGRMFDRMKEGIPHFERMSFGLYGEPLLNRGLADFIDKCRALNDRLVIQVLTNGMALTEKVAKRFVDAKVDIITAAIHAGPDRKSVV